MFKEKLIKEGLICLLAIGVLAGRGWVVAKDATKGTGAIGVKESQKGGQMEEYVSKVIIEAKWYPETKTTECYEGMAYENRRQVFLSWSREIYGKFGKEPIALGFKAYGKFSCIAPQALTWDIKGNIYLLDPFNWQILKFSPDRKYLKTIKLKELPGVKICYTEAIGQNIMAIDSNQNVYLYAYDYERGNSCILKYSLNGEFIKFVHITPWDGDSIGDFYTTSEGKVIASISSEKEYYYKSLSSKDEKTYSSLEGFKFIKGGKGYYFNTPSSELIQIMNEEGVVEMEFRVNLLPEEENISAWAEAIEKPSITLIKENLYILDPVNNLVLEFDKNGTYLGRSKPSEVESLTTVEKKGKFLSKIQKPTKGLVQIIDSKGKIINDVSINLNSELAMAGYRLEDIQVLGEDEKGNLYIKIIAEKKYKNAQTKIIQIHKCNKEGTLISTFAKKPVVNTKSREIKVSDEGIVYELSIENLKKLEVIKWQKKE